MDKERPILMSGDMVDAILEGRKTQTRRIVKTKLDIQSHKEVFVVSAEQYNEEFACNFTPSVVAKNPVSLFYKKGINDIDIECPYGKPGDRLWVREDYKRWCVDGTETTEDGYWSVRYRSDNNIHKHCAIWDCCATYDSPSEVGCDKEPGRWSSPATMPRWASRILLEITGIRVERLQDISGDDAMEEGIRFNSDYDLWMDYQTEQWSCLDPIDSFESLICKINGPETWAKNPWVWVVEFKVVEVKEVKKGGK